MSNKLPPIPYGSPPGSSYWNDWYEKMRTIVNGVTGSFVSAFNGRTGSVTLTSGDVTGALGFTPGQGTVTSVAATVPSIFSISGSPITTSGTLAITYSGVALPVLNGGTGTTTSTGTGSVVLSASPTFTGSPVLPTGTIGVTQAAGDNDTSLATTAFVNNAVTGPAFAVYRTASQSITSNVVTKVQLNTESFDTNSNFDSTTNYRFTPTVAGYYQFSYLVKGSANAGTVQTINALLYKNGTEVFAPFLTGSYAYPTAVDEGAEVGSLLVQMNGTTDYIELFGKIIGTSPSFTGGFLTGFLARAA